MVPNFWTTGLRIGLCSTLLIWDKTDMDFWLHLFRGSCTLIELDFLANKLFCLQLTFFLVKLSRFFSWKFGVICLSVFKYAPMALIVSASSLTCSLIAELVLPLVWPCLG